MFLMKHIMFQYFIKSHLINCESIINKQFVPIGQQQNQSFSSADAYMSMNSTITSSGYGHVSNDHNLNLNTFSVIWKIINEFQ